VKRIFEIIEEDVDRSIPGNSGKLDDLIPTFKHLVYRLILNEQYNGDDEALFEFATANYREETRICRKVMDYLEKQFEVTIRPDEMSYIIILLRKLVK
jgi:transcriptional regulatory protein LevR